ncbi:MAG: hypothetical protein V7606_4803 [Burkholderiales bacterium]
MRLSFPHVITIDAQIIVDSLNRRIRKITPAGRSITLAALFAFPPGVAIDGAGNLYVADTNNATIRKIMPDGSVTTIAGTAGAHDSVDGTGTAATQAYPQGITLDGAGYLYVTESSRVRRVSPAGEVTTIAG